LKFFGYIHAAIDHANDNNLVGTNRVENQIEADHKTTQSRRKGRTLATNEGKSRQVFEIRINPAYESIGRIPTSFFEISVDAKQIGPRSVGEYDPHPCDYLRLKFRAW
jgi:hypothetical protein